MTDKDVIQTIEKATQQAITIYAKYVDLQIKSVGEQLTSLNERVGRQNGGVTKALEKINHLEMENLRKAETCPFGKSIKDLSNNVEEIRVSTITEKKMRQYLYRLASAFLAFTAVIIAALELIIR